MSEQRSVGALRLESVKLCKISKMPSISLYIPEFPVKYWNYNILIRI